MMSFAAALIALVYAFSKYKEQNEKRKVHSVVHVQARTEEAETLDFAITLFADESPGSRQDKINEAFELCEVRRKFNNDRLQQMFKEQQELAEALKKEA